MERKLKTGVVGAGVFGAFHAGKHALSARANLVGVWDIDGVRAQAVADRCCAKSFSTLDDLLASVEAVTIASPAPTHFEIARRALEAGRHVYVEKPLAMNVADADILISLADRKSLVLQVGHQERFVLAVMGAPRKDAMPRRLEFARCGPASGRGEDVSVVFDLMIHDLDIARLFGFGELLKAAACGDRNETVATLIFEGGRQCSFIASRRSEARRRSLIAIYDDGEITIDFVKRSILNTTPARFEHTEFTKDGAFADPLGVSVESFFSAVLEGSRTMVDGNAGRRAIEWAVLIEESREKVSAISSIDNRMIA